VAGPFLLVLMMLQGVKAHGQQLWHRGDGKQEKGGGEGSAERHGGIVAHWPLGVNDAPCRQAFYACLIRMWRKATFSVCACTPI
jgi:hypothetical protein